jgi:transcriptional regulator with XRE-family HTH domain
MKAAAKCVERDHHKIVGAVLAAARQHANITQVDLATRLRKPQSFVSAYELGKRRVDLVEFLLISRTLGTDPMEVFAEIVGSLPK